MQSIRQRINYFIRRANHENFQIGPFFIDIGSDERIYQFNDDVAFTSAYDCYWKSVQNIQRCEKWNLLPGPPLTTVENAFPRINASVVLLNSVPRTPNCTSFKGLTFEMRKQCKISLIYNLIKYGRIWWKYLHILNDPNDRSILRKCVAISTDRWLRQTNLSAVHRKLLYKTEYKLQYFHGQKSLLLLKSSKYLYAQC